MSVRFESKPRKSDESRGEEERNKISGKIPRAQGTSRLCVREGVCAPPRRPSLLSSPSSPTRDPKVRARSSPFFCRCARLNVLVPRFPFLLETIQVITSLTASSEGCGSRSALGTAPLGGLLSFLFFVFFFQQKRKNKFTYPTVLLVSHSGGRSRCWWSRRRRRRRVLRRGQPHSRASRRQAHQSQSTAQKRKNEKDHEERQTFISSSGLPACRSACLGTFSLSLVDHEW